MGQIIKLKGSLFVGDDSKISLNLAQLYNGPASAVSAEELIRALARDPAAADAYRQLDGSTIVEGVVAELQPEILSISLKGARK